MAQSVLEDEVLLFGLVKTAAQAKLFSSAQKSLSKISVDELAKYKAGIRVSLLKDAGFNNFLDIATADDFDLRSIEGVGEKQVEAIRNISNEFQNHIAQFSNIKLSMDDKSPENVSLIKAIAEYKSGRQIREDIKESADYTRYVLNAVEERRPIKNNLRWLFSSKKRKEESVDAEQRLFGYFTMAPFWDRVVREHYLAYQNRFVFNEETALEDFRRNSPEYYAIIEDILGENLPKPLIYSSIPAKLASEIDSFPLVERDFTGRLRAYQKFGAKYILHQRYALLGDDMGLGKTVQAIAAMCHLYSQHNLERGIMTEANSDFSSSSNTISNYNSNPNPNTNSIFNNRIIAGREIVPTGFDDSNIYFLVVCPASVLINWMREINKFSRIPAHLVHGEQMDMAFNSWKAEGGVCVTNYETMGKIVGEIDNKIKLSLMVIDEAHYIKNPDAKRTKYIYALENESERILLMTGTPLENKVNEMCSLIDFVRPDMSEEVRKTASMTNIPEFREMLAPVYLRRLRSDVLDELPEIEHKREWCQLTETDVAYYVGAIRLHSFNDMRRVSFLQDDLNSSSKALRLLELINEAKEDGRKVIIYSFFRETIDKVSSLLKEDLAGTITGSTPPAERQKIIDDFSEKGTALVAQIQAGGTGLNIQSASIVIFCEPQIKPSLENQALSRVYRMGQIRNVLIYHLVCPNTIDEEMLKLLDRKQAIFDEYANESVMGDASENLVDKDWITEFIMKEEGRYIAG